MKIHLNKLFFILIVLLINITAFAQNDVKGFVYEKQTGEPMMFCNVYLKGTTLGASTDINGFFNITKIPDGDYTIMITNLGYDTISESAEIVTVDGIVTSVGEPVRPDTLHFAGETLVISNSKE